MKESEAIKWIKELRDSEEIRELYIIKKGRCWMCGQLLDWSDEE